MTPEEGDLRQRAIDLYCSSDLSTSDVAKQIGVSRSTLYNWLDKAGVTGRRRNPMSADLARVASELSELKATLSRSEADDRWQQAFEQLSLIGELRTEVYARRDANLLLAEEVKGLVEQHFHSQSGRGEKILTALSELRRDVEGTRIERTALTTTVSRLEGLVEGLVVAVQALALGKTTPGQQGQN